mmetsp:Transcript_6540/g.10166  ORF Transcript_6540/g.10166 Transcript_6540/m.10166 type:complete len:161 (+) Transcript_6540:1228-1710(+)
MYEPEHVFFASALGCVAVCVVHDHDISRKTQCNPQVFSPGDKVHVWCIYGGEQVNLRLAQTDNPEMAESPPVFTEKTALILCDGLFIEYYDDPDVTDDSVGYVSVVVRPTSAVLSSECAVIKMKTLLGERVYLAQAIQRQVPVLVFACDISHVGSELSQM